MSLLRPTPSRRCPRPSRPWWCGLVAAVVVGFASVRPASATWSIIIVDERTGEIAIGSATCLTTFDLRQLSPVVLVGVGAAAAQSAIDSGADNRRLIHDQLLGETPPEEIIDLLAIVDEVHETRQYGIVDTQGRAATFTGNLAGAFAGGLTGRTGDLVYAIQGNVITGENVLTGAEQAILDSDGDLPERLMLAMEAAYDFGGDGRCSCSPSDPDGCGSPPPSFDKTAHIGYMIVARLGDEDDVCNASQGCAAGDYFMNFNVAFQFSSAPDPVIQLRDQFDEWRADLVGRPDARRSITSVAPPVLETGGGDVATISIDLRDWQGAPISIDPVSLEAAPDPENSDGVSRVLEIRDLGGGQWEIDVRAGQRAGTDRYAVTVDDGIRPVVLMPRPAVVVEVPADALTLADPVPGTVNTVNTLCVSNGTPGAEVLFAYARGEGVTSTPCGPIGLAAPIVAGSAIVGSDGAACIEGFVGSGARDLPIFLQAVQRDDCARSNVIATTFVRP